MSNIFVINKSNAHVSLKGGYLHIPLGSFIEVLKEELEHLDFKEAISRGWLHLSESKPTVEPVPEPTVITNISSVQGMTAEQLQAELAKTNEASSGNGVNGTALGRQVVTEETSETPTESTEEASAPAKRGRKAATA